MQRSLTTTPLMLRQAHHTDTRASLLVNLRAHTACRHGTSGLHRTRVGRFVVVQTHGSRLRDAVAARPAAAGHHGADVVHAAKTSAHYNDAGICQERKHEPSAVDRTGSCEVTGVGRVVS